MTYEVATLIGGPQAGRRVSVMAGACRFDIRRRQPLGLTSFQTVPTMTYIREGRYHRLPETAPPVFLRQGWERPVCDETEGDMA